MAPVEVIDLISDSEDEGQAASSTLKAFLPRKDKQQLHKTPGSATAPFAGTQQSTGLPQPQSTQYAPIAPSQHRPTSLSTQYEPIAPSTQQYAPRVSSNQHYAPIQPSFRHAPTVPSTTHYATIAPRPLQDHTKPVPENSISGILRRGLQNAAYSAGIVGSQPALTSQAAVAPQWVGGPPEEERQRHFQDYHRKEAERRGLNNILPGYAPLAPTTSLAPEPTAMPLSNGQPPPALQSLTPSVNNVQPHVPYGRRPSPQANVGFEPAAKRPKLVHVEEAEDAVGMQEARRLSLARTGMSESQRNPNDTASWITGIWERMLKHGTAAKHPYDSDSSSDDSLSKAVPAAEIPAHKPARPALGKDRVSFAAGTKFTYSSDDPSPDVAPSGSKSENSAQNPSDTDGSSSLFVPERSKSQSPANNQNDGKSPSDVVPARSETKAIVENLGDNDSPSPDVVPASSKPLQPSSGTKQTSMTVIVDDGSDSDSSSPDVIPAKTKPSQPSPGAKSTGRNAIVDGGSDSDGSSPDVVPARAKPSQPSLSVDVRSGSDSESSSPDFVPAISKPTSQPANGSIAAGAPRANDALKFFLSQLSEPAPQFAVTNDKTPQTRVETNAKPTNMPPQTKSTTNNRSNHGVPYTQEEDDLLKYLREERKVSWDDMLNHFAGRTRGSLQVRYSTKLKHRQSPMMNREVSDASIPSLSVHEAATQQEYAAPARRIPKAAVRHDGMVSWGEIKAKNRAERAVVIADTIEHHEPMQIVNSGPDVATAASISRLLRSREMGHTGGRSWSSKSRLKVPGELQNHVLDTLGPRKFFHGASRDVTCVAWANDGNRFAAGAIAIDDERSMQYNRPNNLLLGNNEMNSLKELPEHHVSRPAVSDANNVNSLHAMQETQDSRLFKTVAAVAFSGDSRALYSAGGDGVVRMYDSATGECTSSFSQGAEVVLLAANSRGTLASGCHRSDDGSISVLSDQLDSICKLGPSRTDVQSSLPIFPSALKWGAGRYSGLLLAGFASDSYDEDRLAAGEVCLWNLDAENKIELPTVRNVFDVAWNPFPSASASLFAIACTRPGRRFRSSIACFAPNQGRARPVINWDCQAFDINDVVFCPHDDNLIAAGATDGKVYIWDKRFANRSQAPLHIFAHGPTKNVLDHDRDMEMADTGVRFLSWSATSNRLYSGSSDGTVKVWNPYCTTKDALVRNVATFNSAVMSGAFSPDYRELLIGEDQGQVNLLGIDREERPVRAAKKFDYYPAPPVHAPKNEDRLAPARELLASQQIELRPMGALPTRQAVQGPKYQGPFLAPSEEHTQELVDDYQLALQQQKRVHSGLPHNAETKELIKSAKLQVSQTRDAMQRAQLKLDDFNLLAPAASLLQDKFRESRHAWKKDKVTNGTKSCRLDCNYLPAAGDDDGEAPDDRKSEQRMPGNLRPQRKILNAGDMTNSEIAEAGLTSKCIACTGPAAKPKRSLPLCERCSLSRSGLTARCGKCAAPIRPSLNEGDNKDICERCSFHCFRCGSVAAVSHEGDVITCDPCGIQWEAGALGYEVKRSLKPAVARVSDEKSHDHEMESLEQRMMRLLGDDERERLAGGWKVALVDGTVGL